MQSQTAGEPRRTGAAVRTPGSVSAMTGDDVAVESYPQKVESPDGIPSTEGAREPGTTKPRRTPWLAIALVVGFLLNVAWRLWLVRDIQVPAAHADEDGYLLAARALAGGPGGYSTENTAFRRVGYPLLLAPIYWFTSNPFQVYRGAQLVDALVNSLTFPLAYLFARRVFAQPRSWSLGLGLLVASMPAVVFYSQYAMTDAVLVTFALTWLLLLHTWLTATTGRGRMLAALGASATAGAIYVLHVRGTMVVAVHLIAVVAFAVLRRTSWRLSLAAVVMTAFVAVSGDKVLQYVLAGDITTDGRSPRSQMVAALTTVHGAANTAARTFGQLWYLAVGTWGLGAVGLVALVIALWPLRDLRGRLRERIEGGRLLILLTTLVATALIASASSASLPTYDHRINYYAYPRYIHFLFPVWMMAGVVALRLVNGRRLRMLALSAAGLTLFSAGVVYLRLQFNKATVFLPFDAPETTFLSWQWGAIRVTQPTIAALVLLGLLVFTLPRSRTVAVAMGGIVALHAAVMILSVEKITKPMTEDQYRADTPLLVRDAHLGPGDVVAVSTATQWYLRWNVMREVYWGRIEVFNSATEGAPDGANVVIAPDGYTDRESRNWHAEPRFHRVAVDGFHHWSVWRKN
jgi:4-amino-4-deoxy-L-arabinose transferase-like glycosyltransferase